MLRFESRTQTSVQNILFAPWVWSCLVKQEGGKKRQSRPISDTSVWCELTVIRKIKSVVLAPRLFIIYTD